MQGRVCAYCGISSNGLDVEHFRPKGPVDGDENHGGYWWLAYDGSNYFLSCPACNRNRKRSYFPLQRGATRCTYEARRELETELRVLLDPAADDVEEWLTIAPEDVSARLIPHPSLGETERRRVQDAIELFGLNLNPEIRRQRFQVYLEAARAAAEHHCDNLRRMAMRHRSHSLVARIVLQRNAPDQLPSPELEMRELVDLLWSDLRTMVHEIWDMKAGGRAPSAIDKRERRALCWALVALRGDPPVGDSASADDYFGALLMKEPAEIRAEFVALFRGLR
jgi:uncharacterized protein (TIGR02646 family)